MGYRGMGGFRGDLIIKGRRRARYTAGDLVDAGGVDTYGGGFDQFGGGLDTSTGTPDFSDVTGGSSGPVPVDMPDPMSAGLPSDLGMYLGQGAQGIGSAIQKFLGSSGGSSAAAGMASAAGAVARSGGRKMLQALRKAYRKSPADVEGWRPRRMNPGNFKALRRSMRRLKAFEHAARRVITFTHPKPHARVKFKFGKRRRR